MEMIGYDKMKMINSDIRSRSRFFVSQKNQRVCLCIVIDSPISLRYVPFRSVFSLLQSPPPCRRVPLFLFSFSPLFLFSFEFNRDSTKEKGKKRTFPRLVIKNKQKGIDVIDVRTEGLLQEDRLVP